MPALKNAKHERFAQFLARGEGSEAAYAKAGYKPHRQNAARLMSNDDVAARVAEILNAAAIRAEVSVSSISTALLRLAEKGEALADASGLSVSRASLMDVAKLNGLIVDRKEVSGPNGDPVAVEVLRQKDQKAAKSLAASLGVQWESEERA